uniref:Tankyrase 1-binding protein C-terminal domain-containing protein n=1 Tax=Anabas testudineus TaxID=64144 RepID=A0AAQ6IGW0_ANATE
MLRETQREVASAKEVEQEEVPEAPPRLKRLHTEEQPKPKATYFALTAQIQEPVSPVDAGAKKGGMTSPFDDFSVRSLLGSSQGKNLPVRRNPSLDEAFGKTIKSQDQADESLLRSHMSLKEIRSVSDGQTSEEMMEVEKNREKQQELERERHKQEKERQERQRQREEERQRELDKERHLLEIQKEKQKLEELEKFKELERQQLLEFQKQKQKEKEMQQALELEKQRQREKVEREEAEKIKQMALEQETLRLRELDKERERQKEMEKERQKELEWKKRRELERQRQLDIQRQELENQRLRQQELEKERRRKEEMERQQLLEFQKQKQKEKEMQQALELEQQRQKEKMVREEAEKRKQMALEQETLRLRELDKERERQKEMEKERQKELEWEKQRELERQRQKDLEKERQRQLDIERQEIENQRRRQQELEKERRRKEEMERMKEMERQQLLEFEKQKQAERERQQVLELEKRRLREKMEEEEAEKIRQVAKQQEAERQRLKEKLKKEEQDRAKSESSPLRPKVVDLDSVLWSDPLSKATPQRSDPATRWKEPSPRAEESYKPAILDIDSFTSQTQLSPSKDLFSVSSIQGVDSGLGSRLQPTPERDVSWKVPSQTSGSFSSPVWTTSPQDPWEMWPNEISVDKPMAEPRKQANRVSPEQLFIRQEERQLAPQRHWSTLMDEPHLLAPFNQTRTGIPPGGASSSFPAEPVWFPREPQRQDSSREIQRHRRSQELNRMRSRSVSRRSAPSSSAMEGNLSRMRSRSAHRERDRHSWVPQKQGVRDEEEGKDSETPVHETDSQYGTWETGLRTDDSLTPATPSSESNLSPSPRKPTPPHTPGERGSQFESDSPDSLLPSSSSESQTLSFPDAPTTLLDTSALRSRAQLAKKRAPRTRPTRATRQSAVLADGESENTEDWLYRDSTEAKVESKDDSDSEEQNKGADASPAVSSQPQRIALFPGVDPSSLKAQLKRRGDSDNQIDGPAPATFAALSIP